MLFDDNLNLGKLQKNWRLVVWWILHRLTTPLRAMPDFLIVGTQKGGTTSLFNYLIQHPRIYAPFRKEIKFFDSNYFNGLSWYRAHFPLRRKLEHEHALTGEATPYYMFHPTAPERISQALPDVRIIVLLRNPVDRAYSHYQHMVRAGRETLSFEEALEKEPERLNGEAEKIAADMYYPQAAHIYYSYLARGRYIEQLPKLFSLFSPDRVLVLRSEDLYTSPRETFFQTLDFLKLPRWEPPRYEIFKQGTYDKTLDPKLRQRLAEYFRPYNRQLYDFLGRDFEWDK
jgi:hypothetical protein